MSKPEALRLADELDAVITPYCLESKAAAELRRLSDENESLRQIVQDFPPVEAELREVSDQAHRLEQQRDALLEALKLAADELAIHAPDSWVRMQARAAIKAVEGEKT